MLFEKLIDDTTDYKLEELLKDKLMDILAHTVDFSLLKEADKKVLQKIVDEYEVRTLYLEKKTTQANQD